jgi:hypothetical protein
MKKQISFFVVSLTILLFSCTDKNEKTYGTVVFGANYHAINCITSVDVFIEGKHVGQLEVPADSVPDCELNYGLKQELETGNHSYKIEIRPMQGIGCTKDITGNLKITESGCETVFIDYFEVFENE